MKVAAHADPLPVGAILRGRFELLEVIGRGGISTVYRAIDRMRVLAATPDSQVAIKLVSAEGNMRQWGIEIVHREAHHLRQLRHPNIVQVFDSDQDGGFHFVVLELLQGRAIGRILQSLPHRTLPLDLALRVVAGAAAGLSHAHDRGIVHGDLKPNNIFITENGEVKLLDFGAARLINSGEPSDVATINTEEFDAITPMYASIETLRGEVPNQSDDVFSLGIVTYVMITGNHPFGGTTALEAWRLGMQPERPPGLSKRKWQALSRAIAFEHQFRTDSVAKFVREFGNQVWWDRLLGWA